MRTQSNHHEKASLISKVDELMFDGLSQNAACAQLGVPPSQIVKWRRAYSDGGLGALQNNYKNCGRKPMYRLTKEETQALRELVLMTDPTQGLRCNKILAAQLFARDPRCSEELRRILESLGAERQSLPPTISKAMQLRKSEKDIYRGPKRSALEGIFTPRDLSWVIDGQRRALRPGDIFESDDMTLNGMFWVPWDNPSDKCSARWGCRVFRAQLLPWLDVATGCFVAYSLVLRDSDAYKASDIRWALNHLFNSVGIPKVLRFEHGSWSSNSVEAIEHDVNICKIVHAKTAKGKIIEGRFNQLQRICAANEVHLGRKRGEFEKSNSQWMSYRKGTHNPREFLPSLEEQCRRLDAAFDFLNSKPINGELYGPQNARKLYNLQYWIPQQLMDNWYLNNPRPRKPELEEVLAVLPHRAEVSIRHGLARVKIEDFGGVYYFYHEEFVRMGDGWPIAICFDPTDPEQGAGIISLRPTDDARNLINIPMNHFVGKACYVDRVPQVTIGRGDTLGFETAKHHAKLAHLLYREIIPAHHKRGVSVHDYRDSSGNSNRTEVNLTSLAQSFRHDIAEVTRDFSSNSDRAKPITSNRRITTLDPEVFFK